MKYMLMIWEPDVDWDAAPPEHLTSAMENHDRFAAMLNERGIEYWSQALRHGGDATTIRRAESVPEWVRAPLAGGQMLVTDGPFVELKEQLGGFYIIDARDLDEALDLAKHLPVRNAVEVRPVWDPRQAIVDRDNGQT